MKLFIDLLILTALVITSSYLYGIIRRYVTIKSKIINEIIYGIVFSVIGIIGMLVPVELISGVTMDGRTIIVAIAAIFGGIISSVISAIALGTYR